MKITTWNIRHGGGSRIKEISQFCSENRDSDVLVITEFRNNKNKDLKITIMKKEKKVMTPKRKEIIKNLSITISKESKKVNGRNIKLIETLQKILDKAKP